MRVEEILLNIEKLDQEIKIAYLEYALKKKLPDGGIGNNDETVKFIRDNISSELFIKINENLKLIRTELVASSNKEDNYKILRELYLIRPTIHELWFLQGHYRYHLNMFFSGDLGLQFLFSSYKKGTLEETLPHLSASIFKHIILLENFYQVDPPSALLAADVSYNVFEKLKDVIDNYQLSDMDTADMIAHSRYLTDLSTINQALLNLTGYDVLFSGELVSKMEWLFYAPCAINEGVMFLRKNKDYLVDNIDKKLWLNDARENLREYLYLYDFDDLYKKGKELKNIIKGAHEFLEKYAL